MKTQSKSWITKGIVTSIRKKAKIHSKLLKVKDQTRKEALNQEYKIYKNLLTNITKKSKENYQKQYFIDNKNNLINVWKGIKEIILIKKKKRKKTHISTASKSGKNTRQIVKKWLNTSINILVLLQKIQTKEQQNQNRNFQII